MANPKKPTEAKVFNGTFRKDRDVPIAEQCKSLLLETLPDPPDSLGDRGRGVWCNEGALLIAGKMLRTTDLLTLEMLCRTIDNIEECNGMIAEHGAMLVGSTGSLVINPGIPARQSAITQYRHFAGMLGLSPSARSKIPAAGSTTTAALGLGSLSRKRRV